MARTFNPSFVCTAALLCASVLVARADEAAPTPLLAVPTPPLAAPPPPLAAHPPPRSEAEWKALIASLKPLPPVPINQPVTFDSPTISLVTTPSSQVAVATFLQRPVSFQVKGASFLSAFDAVLTAAGKACPIECRGIKPMKVTFGAQGDNVGIVLDTLAKMGGASLWLLPDKLLLCRADSLSDTDKEKAKPWSVLISKATPLPVGNGKLPGGQAHYMALLNTKISTSLDGGQFADGFRAYQSALTQSQLTQLPLEDHTYSIHFQYNKEQMAPRGIITNVSFSFEDVTFGEALGTLAHMQGDELYLMPDHLLISPPGSLTPEQQKVAIPVFAYPGFGKTALSPLPAPSAPNS